MNISILNPYVIKILISSRKEDSIIGISKRIGLSYGWVYKWVKELVKEGVFKERWRGIILQEDNENFKKIIDFIKTFHNVQFYYSALNLMGIKYCLTKTDAVYIWTEGGYNIARYRDYYPIFIKIKKSDYQIFLYYCKKLGLNIDSEKGIFYSPNILDDFEAVKKDNFYVDSLPLTIKFMNENIYNFQPALEMIEERYGRKLNIKYKEVNGL